MSTLGDKTNKDLPKGFRSSDTEPTTSEEPREITSDDLHPIREAIINLNNEANKLTNQFRTIKKDVEEHNIKFKNQEDKIKKQADNFSSQAGKIETLKNDIENQKNRIPEIVGLFSAIIALVLVDVNIIKSANSFLSAILLIVALTCSVAIFAVLIHLFFAPVEKVKFTRRSFLIPNIILAVLIIVGMLLYFLNIDINKIRPEATIKNQQYLNLPDAPNN
ncbi:MAG: hypothetical protein PHU56_00225 [Candidatus Pacebacteria bacterium]|nr:hypothetical protein [Candidatus Paceibacterota bacterium]